MPLTCCHCGGTLFASRTGDGLRMPYGLEPSFVLAARCPYPHCSRVVCFRASDGGGLELAREAEVTRWSPAKIVAGARQWLWLGLVIAVFSVIPAYGLHEGVASLRCGGIAWLFFFGGSLLALVPVIYFVRGLAWAGRDALRVAAHARETVRAGATGGVRLAPDPVTYRSH